MDNLIDRTKLLDKLEEEYNKYKGLEPEWYCALETAISIVKNMKPVKLDIIRTDVYDL